MTFNVILERYADAVYNKDVDGFMSLYDSNVCIYDTWKEWMNNEVTALRSMATEWFDSLGKEKVRVEFTQLNVLESSDQAVWIGEVKYYGLDEDNEILRSISNRLTWVIKKNSEGFKIVHEHSSLPINMETFTGIVKKE